MLDSPEIWIVVQFRAIYIATEPSGEAADQLGLHYVGLRDLHPYKIPASFAAHDEWSSFVLWHSRLTHEPLNCPKS